MTMYIAMIFPIDNLNFVVKFFSRRKNIVPLKLWNFSCSDVQIYDMNHKIFDNKILKRYIFLRKYHGECVKNVQT